MPYAAPRGQKTASSRILSEAAGPQGAAATVGCVAAGAPLLVVPALRGDDGVDGTTVFYLRKVALAKKKVRRRKQEEAEHERRTLVLGRRVSANKQLTPAESFARCAWAGHLPSQEKRRNRKKKRKKLPKSSPRSSSGRAPRTLKTGHSSTSPL